MDIDNSADNTELLAEKLRADAVDRELGAFLRQVGLQAVRRTPFVGDALSVLENIKQQHRFDNIEKTVLDLKSLAESHGSQIRDMNQDLEQTRAFVVDAFERAGDSRTEPQRERTLRSLRNALLTGVTERSYSEQAFMLRAADEMYDPDVDVLVEAYQAEGRGEKYFVPEDMDMKIAGLERMRSFGFIILIGVPFGREKGGQAVRFGDISSLGKRFVEFALDDHL